jgi:hypothetical protein
MEAMQATDELGLEPIDGPPNVDQVRAQGVCRELVDGLADECIDSVIDTVSRIRYGEGFHWHIVPNTCSLQHGQCGSLSEVTAISGSNTSAGAPVDVQPRSFSATPRLAGVAPLDIRVAILGLCHDFEDSSDNRVPTHGPPLQLGNARGRRPLGHRDVRRVASMTREITLVAPAGIEPAHKV